MLRNNGRLIARSFSMILIAIVLSTLVFQLSGYSAGEAISGFVQGAITGPGALMSTVRWAVPLAVVGVGVVLSFRAGFFNVGAQGQLYVGAIAAAAIGPVVPGPGFVKVAIAMVCAAIAGMLWSLIAAWLKTSTGADEVLTTLMLNFIGTLLLQYVTNGPLRDLSGSGQVASAPPLGPEMRITGSSGVSVVNIALVLAVLVGSWLIVNRTTFGLSSTIVGRNAQVATRQGVNSRSVIWVTFGLSGALAGVAGAFEVLGPTGRLIQGFSPDVGFTGILVALVAGLTIAGVAFAALFFGALAAAIQFLPIVTNLPTSALEILQGLVALLITAKLRANGIRRSRPDSPPARAEPGPGDDLAVAAPPPAGDGAP